MSILVAVVNGDSEIEYDREKPLAEPQQQYLNKMDEKMDKGIPGGQGNIFAPNQQQKTEFVADQLMLGIETSDEQLISVSMAYLASRLPELKQVESKEKDGQKHITLIFDREYTAPQEVKFVRPEHLNS